MPEVEIKFKEGNIAIQEKLFSKYKTAREIFDNEANNFDCNVKIVTNISDILNKYDLTNVEEVKKCAIQIFNKYHTTNTFINNGYKILVTSNGIKESIQKIFFNNEQKNLLMPHLLVFTRLGFIIEHAVLVTQGSEVKKRRKISYWNYYLTGININGINYIIELEIRSMDSGENQYRIQRIEIKEQ